MSNEITRKESETPNPDEDFEKFLESNVETLKRTISELDAALDQAGDETNQGQVHNNSSPAVGGTQPQVGLPELVSMDGATKLVLTDFEEAIALLEQDQVGVTGELKIIIAREIATQLSDRFPINSYFQKLQDRDNIEIRQQTSTNSQISVVYLTEDRVYYPVTFGSVEIYLELVSSDIYQPMVEEFDTQFSEADELDLAVPPWRELLEGLAEATSKETAKEFEILVEAATPENLDSLDEVSLALIAAARTGALQYDISKWGEEMNIGSKATFSRRKSSLVDDGVVTTEPVQVEIGRPRERLLLAEDDSKVTPDTTPTEPEEEQSDASQDDKTTSTEGTRTDAESEAGDLDDILDEMLKDVLLTDN